MTVNDDGNAITFTPKEDEIDATTSDYGSSYVDGKLKFKFKWSLDVSKLIEKYGIAEADTSRRLTVMLKNEGETIVSTASGIVNISDKPLVAPGIETSLDDIKDWTNVESVSVNKFIANNTTTVDKYKYKLEGAKNVEETEKAPSEIESPIVTITEEGITKITVYFTEKRGTPRTSPVGTFEVKIDRTSPKITINENKQGDYVKSITLNVEDPTDKASDNNVSGISESKYFMSTQNIEKQTLTNKIFSDNNAKGFNNNDNINLSNLSSGPYYLYIMSKDKAGNVTYEKSEHTYVVDKVDPEITITPNENSAYKNDVQIKVKVVDELSKVNKDSIKYLWKEVQQTPNDEDFSMKPADISDIENGYEFTVPVLENIDTKYYLYIYAEDNAGNKVKKSSEAYYIDNVKPTITLSIDGNTLYKSRYTVYIKAEDKNGLNVDKLKYFWDTATHELEGIDEQLFKNTFTNGYAVTTDSLKEDGKYYLYVLAYDKAGNKATYKSQDPFYIDKNAPTVSFEPNGNSEDLKNILESVNVTIEDTSSVSNKKYKWVDNSYYTPTDEEMEKLDGDSVKLPTADGEYYLWVYASDTLGMCAKVKSEKFIIDKTAPSAPTILAKKSNFEVSNGSTIKPDVELEIKPGVDSRADAKVTLVDVVITRDTSNTIPFTGDKITLNENGLYKITAKCEDDAGNKSEEVTLEFTIDENALDIPKIELKGADDDSIIEDNAIVNKDVKIEVSEIEGQTTEIIILDLDDGENDVTSNFKTDKGIVINKSGYYKITFKISKDTQHTEIEMHITIDIENPVAKDKEYSIDYNQSFSDFFEATDNRGIKEYQVVKEPENGEITLDDSVAGKFTYTPKANYYGTDTVIYKVIDEAGNVSNEATITITIRKVLEESDIIDAGSKKITMKKNQKYTSSALPLIDKNGDVLEYIIFDDAKNGVVEFDAQTGILTYTPNKDYIGVDSFELAVTNKKETIYISLGVVIEDISSGGNHGGGTTTKKYKITVEASVGGTISPNTVSVEKGLSQTFKIIPDEGYEIEDVLVDGESVGAVNEYIFNDVTENHTIEAKFKKIEVSEPKVEYDDVPQTSWYSEAIDFVTRNNLMNGTGNGKFDPELSITRGMLVTVLYRLSGATVTELSTFDDVASDSYYSNAIAWAEKNGIVNGIGNNLFDPDREIKREEMAIIFARYIKNMGVEIVEENDDLVYADEGEISDYARDAVHEMRKAGLMNGKNENSFDPVGSATRGEAATILMRFVQKISK